MSDIDSNFEQWPIEHVCCGSTRLSNVGRVTARHEDDTDANVDDVNRHASTVAPIAETSHINHINIADAVHTVSWKLLFSLRRCFLIHGHVAGQHSDAEHTIENPPFGFHCEAPEAAETQRCNRCPCS